ncbi:MAG TPA: methyltransferase domain-containing protein [Candidatus Goldiibacteriota bacterium]|nr:methyltransferase domain-containing protein [Candidatus Goldiibacteriota bacterium]
MQVQQPVEKSNGKNGSKNRVITKGPVKNLEQHVHPEWWRNIFNSYYIMTDGDVVEDNQITKQEIDFFSDAVKLKKDECILDLCCGQGRHTIELASRGFKNVQGMDRSHYLISRAKTVSKAKNLTIKFKEGDARKIPYSDDTFDVLMLLGNSFGYFETLNDDVMVLKEVVRVLKPGGRVLIDVTDGDYVKKNFSPRSWEWIDKKHFVCRERSLSADGERLISREVVTDTKKGVVVDQFYAERLYNADSISFIMKKAGLSSVYFHGAMNTESKRNQDLGMMERRVIVTAVVEKERAPEKQKKDTKVRDVVVVMGDPKKPDSVKPSEVFDDDDFQTIDRLKDALEGLKQYNFSFMNNHANLIDDLKKVSQDGALVLNLCDEGYDNDPRKELHVPAFFEMLNIKYTGGGPQCLAYCYDKSLVRGIAAEMGIPVPKAFFIKPEDITYELPVNFSFPLIVKPNFGDSSFGITRTSVVHNLEQLDRAISDVREKTGYEKPILVEEFLIGSDITVGIIGNPPESYRIMPITEEDYSDLPPDLPKICGYEAKWDPSSPYWKYIKTIPAKLPAETEKNIQEWCVKLFERLECRDYARLDWRLDSKGKPKLLEVNPNPGWCWDGHLAKMSKMDNVSYSQMLGLIIKAAEKRYDVQEKRKLNR